MKGNLTFIMTSNKNENLRRQCLTGDLMIN
jgi:hypothetical protein